MSDSSDEDDQRKVMSTSSDRMSQPGPSWCLPTKQGYCGYCKVPYSNLDQHLSSPRHLDLVHLSSRGITTGRTKVNLLERFLQDVLQHHPHHCHDSRPSHSDMHSVSVLPQPRIELDDVCQDTVLLGTQEYLPCADDAFCQLANQKEGVNNCCQTAETITHRLSAPITEQGARDAPTEHIYSPQTQSLPPKSESLPTIHKKAHRKSNRRKTSDSSSPTRDLHPSPGCALGHCPGVNLISSPGYGLGLCYSPGSTYGQAQNEDMFYADHRDNMEQTIEEVIQMFCYGISSRPQHQEEINSLQFSLPASMETQNEDWDSPMQVVFQSLKSPALVSQIEHMSWLMDVQVHMDDQIYSSHLNSALNTIAGGQQNQGFWTLPIEQVLPVPKYIPDCFKGKTWTQIEQEDEEKVEKLICQFKKGTFICYFDSESLSRYGMWKQNKGGRDGSKEAESEPGILPPLDFKDDLVYLSGRRRDLRLVSRCEVVKVSHSTQTVRLVSPAVHQPAPQPPPSIVTAPNAVKGGWTPETCRSLPQPYSSIITPVQPQTSLVYLLCSSEGSATPGSPVAGPSPRRSRKRRRPLNLQGLKIKYRPFNMRFYDPSTNRIIRTPPKGFLWHQGRARSSPLPLCVRQLFRSLSPELNSDRLLEEGGARGSSIKGQRSADPPLSVLFGTLSGMQDKDRRGGQISEPIPPQSKAEQGALHYTRKNMAQTTPSDNRRSSGSLVP